MAKVTMRIYKSSFGGWTGVARAKLFNGLVLEIAPPMDGKKKPYSKSQITKALRDAIEVAREGVLI